MLYSAANKDNFDMKGIWLKNLIFQVLSGRVSSKDAVTICAARVKRKPLSMELGNIQFQDVDHIFWSILADIYVNRIYMPDGLEIGKNDTVVDIGAHKGGFSAFAASIPGTTIHAYEPHPENHARLKMLIEVNHLSNIIPHNVAIAGRTGSASLFLSPISSRHTLQGSDVVIGEEATEVPALSLDDCLKDLPRVDFLKMDCEGAEVEILMNASVDTLKKINRMAVETHFPIHSDEMKLLITRLKQFFPSVSILPQGKEDLGYLYAKKESVLGTFQYNDDDAFATNHKGTHQKK